MSYIENKMFISEKEQDNKQGIEYQNKKAERNSDAYLSGPIYARVTQAKSFSLSYNKAKFIVNQAGSLQFLFTKSEEKDK